MKNYVQLRKILLGGAAVGMFMVPALAQEQMETVTVTGIRASLQSAQAIKQNSNQVVDSITAVDIGALPDRNVAEALQRVPGVTLVRGDTPNDLVRMGSTGNNVFVRGLSWVQTTLNGRDEFSAINGRTLAFADVSADLLSGVDVFKSATASQIEGGIGGSIDLKTRKPFDTDGMKFAVSGDYTYGDMSDSARPSGNALFSDRFNTSIGEIGILASVDWQDQLSRTSGINLNTFDCWTSGGTKVQAVATDSSYNDCTSAAGSKMAPAGFAWRQLDYRQQRLAGDVVLQWRPNEKLEFTLSGFNTFANGGDVEHYVYMDSSDYTNSVSTAKYSGNQWIGGTGKLSGIDTRAGAGHDRTSDISLNVKWTPTDNFEISIDSQYVDSDRQYLNNTMATGVRNAQTIGIDISDKDQPKITYSDPSGLLSSGDNYYYYWAMDHMDYNSAHSFANRIDATYKFQGDGLFGFIKSVEAGFRAQNKYSVARATDYNWDPIDPVAWGASGVSLAGNFFGSSYTAVDGTTVSATSISDNVKKLVSYGKLFHYDKIFGSAVPALYVPGNNLVLMNTYASSVLTHSINPGWGTWSSYTYDVGCKTQQVTCLAAYANTTVGDSVAKNSISPQTQDTYAGYAQANFATANLFGWNIPIDGNIGVRVIHTDHVTETGKLVMPSAPQVDNAYKSATTGCAAALGHDMTVGDDTTKITSCADYDKAVAFWGGYGNASYSVPRGTVKTGYWNVLPSFNATAHLSDQLQARLGYSETMLRPEFAYTSNAGSYSFNWGSATTAKAFTFDSSPSGYSYNPLLKPMHSTNLDASLEWYFSPSGSVAISVFGKRISNYIYTQTETQTVISPSSGVAMDFANTSYVNGQKGGIDGWELSYQQFFDFLPSFWSGFGVQANYTKIYNWGGHNNSGNITASDAVASGNAALPMEGMSHDSYNVALMFAKYDIDARLAWNWRSTFMSSSANSNAPREPVWLENYGQLDGSIFYSFLDHYKVGVQITNITGSEFHTDEGYTNYHPRENWIASDRKYAVVLRANW